MLLPTHPQPQTDEILSSWMVRLAFANGFPLHTFYSNLLGYKAPIWNRDTDRHPAAALLEMLSRCTGQSLSAVYELTLDAYSGILFEQLSKIGNAQWILPVGVLHRQRLRAGMQFCPLCLQSSSGPYFRRSWRLAFYALCEYHQCVMQQYCPSCLEPIAFHRHGIGRGRSVSAQLLQLCHHCEFDLRRTIPAYLDWPDLHSFKSFIELIRFSAQGTWKCGPLTPPCSVLFFIGLRALVGVISGRHGQRLRDRLSDTLGCRFDVQYSAHHIEFEQFDALDRLKLLLAVIWLLDDWPNRFVVVCGECGFTRSRLAEDVRALPFWLASVADKYLDGRRYLPDANEIFSAGTYLLGHHQNVTPRTLGQILGLSKDSARVAWRLWIERSLN